jgi:hypothetical protein
MLKYFTVYGNVKNLNVNCDKRYWFHPKACDTPEEEYTLVMNSPWYKKMSLDPLEELLMPCALYHNFTGIDVDQKHSLGPWTIALLLPKTDVRHKKSLSWHHMFMIDSRFLQGWKVPLLRGENLFVP